MLTVRAQCYCTWSVIDMPTLKVKHAVGPSVAPTREEIIAANPIVDFVRNRGYQLKRAGKNFVTDGCPVCKHKARGHRPVMLYAETQSWNCHDCERGGSVIDWVMMEKNVSAAEAIRELCGNNEISQIVATYNYTDENGTLLFQCVRYEPKDFRQRQPDGQRWLDMEPQKRAACPISTARSNQSADRGDS